MNNTIVSTNSLIRKYSCYTKNLIISSCIQLNVQEVHFGRILPTINRIFDSLPASFHVFYAEDGKTYAHSFLKMLVDLGEIVSIKNGYYAVPPTRLIKLPATRKSIILSSLQEPTFKCYLGLAGGYSDMELDMPSLTIDEWAFALSPEILLEKYELQLHLVEKFEPMMILAGTKEGIRRRVDFARLTDKETYIVMLEQRFGDRVKKDYYLGQYKQSVWHVSRIDMKYYTRLCFALELRKGKKQTYRIRSITNKLSELSFEARIPKEEQAMLALFAMPSKRQNATTYLVPNEHLQDVDYILKRLNMNQGVN